MVKPVKKIPISDISHDPSAMTKNIFELMDIEIDSVCQKGVKRSDAAMAIAFTAMAPPIGVMLKALGKERPDSDRRKQILRKIFEILNSGDCDHTAAKDGSCGRN